VRFEVRRQRKKGRKEERSVDGWKNGLSLRQRRALRNLKVERQNMIISTYYESKCSEIYLITVLCK
jgi:hypothetical protein